MQIHRAERLSRRDNQNEREKERELLCTHPQKNDRFWDGTRCAGTDGYRLRLSVI